MKAFAPVVSPHIFSRDMNPQHLQGGRKALMLNLPPPISHRQGGNYSRNTALEPEIYRGSRESISVQGTYTTVIGNSKTCFSLLASLDRPVLSPFPEYFGQEYNRSLSTLNVRFKFPFNKNIYRDY